MGVGINLFRQLFPEDYYAYQTATLISSKPVSKKIYDSDNNVIAEYPLGGDELRGLLQVVDGQLVAYGDIKPSDGNGTEVFDIVDLGSLTWTNFASASKMVYMPFEQATKPASDNIKANIICSSYVTVSRSDVGYSAPYTVVGVGIDDSGKLFVTNPNSNWASKEDAKSDLDGVYLIYEKATPTAKSYTPFSNPMISGSTEEFTDSRSLKMFVGHDSYYEKDLIVPDTPTADGTYTLKCVVSHGEPTLNWQADS